MVLLLAPAIALARAGGGENYHDGGGGHGGGGGDGGGGGGAILWLVFRLIILCFQHPVLGLPVLVIIAVVAYYIYSKRVQLQNVPRQLGASPPGFQSPVAQVGQIQQNDPAFDEAAFLARVRAAFVGLQEAWCAQNLDRVRPFISDGVYERFSLQFAEQRDAGYRDQLDGLAVQETRVADVASDGTFDEISVWIRARADDYRVSLSDGRRIPSPTTSGDFVEVWSFLRRRGAQTVAGKSGLIEGHCPNCGVAIEMNQSANCTHCKALLRSGEYDWVLAEITQASEWKGGTRDQVAGFEAMRQRDPGFNVQAMEDRTSVVFWRQASAWRLGQIAPIKKVASPEFCTGFEASLQPPPGRPRQFFGECAVGSVDVARVDPGEAGGADDRCVVQVRWSAQRLFLNPQGALRAVTPEFSNFTTLFVLSRKAGVQTDVGTSVSSGHCPNCGAPESGGASNACEFCGAVLNDGAHGWVLTAATAANDPAGRAVLSGNA